MKNYFIYLILCTLVINGCVTKSSQPEWQKKYDDPNVIRKMFVNPPMFYAPHTFWFWDDTIRDEHFAASMIEEMARQRLNPGYAHPRSSGERLNNQYPSLPYEKYLEEPWFNSFGNALQKAKKKKTTLGYCDEYDWPSGQAAGRVLKQHPELEAKYLDWKRYEVKGKTTVQYDSIDFAVAGRIIEKKIDASTLQLIGEGNNLKWTAPEGEWVIYTYTKKFHPGIDGGKVNYLDPKLMETFIPLVHEQYAKRFGNNMGKSIPGVFVDNEGDYGWQMAWSEYLAQQYEKMKNRDIRLWLPLLTEKDKDGLFAKARCDWFDVVSEVYKTCYFEPLVDWLKQRNMYYISNLWEESLLLQSQAVGDYMRITRTITMPGTDCLEMKSQDVHDFKETQSVAEFEDRPFMSEIMGVVGWGMTPEMMKMTINSITSFGVNHVVPHGIYLNRKLETIPYPPDWFTENPYWPYLHYWTDFARRAAFITRQSQLVADVLLINPLESVWALTESYFSNEHPTWDQYALEIDQTYASAMRKMNENNIDFLIADKYYLDKGKVDSSKDFTQITINNHEFSAMVLPPMCVISHPASNKILEFAKRGGIVLILGELPQGSPEEGVKDTLIISQMKALKQLPTVVDLATDKNRLSKMVTVLNEKIKPQIQLENSGRLYTAHRKIAANDFYWFANNTDTIRNFTAWLRDGEGVAEIWNCETGEIKTIASEKENKYNKVSLTLQPYEGYWLVFNSKEKNQNKSGQAEIPTKEIMLDGKWTLSYPGKDTIYKTTAKAEFTAEKTINEEKLKPGYNDSEWKYYSFIRQTNRKAIAETTKVENGNVYWRINIPVGCQSMIFNPNMIGRNIWIDGKKTKLTDTIIDIPVNAALLSFVWPERNQKKILTSPLKFVVGKKENCSLQSWYSYGLQQYTGYVDYETTYVTTRKPGSKILLDLGNVKYMAEVFVNDKSVGARLWPPFTFDISNELAKGENKIRIRIGNLMVGEMWIKEDMSQLRTWGWRGRPDFDKYDAGLSGPVKLLITNK